MKRHIAILISTWHACSATSFQLGVSCGLVEHLFADPILDALEIPSRVINKQISAISQPGFASTHACGIPLA